MIITISDIQKAGFCVRGAKTWFNDHGWSNDDFRRFLKEGMSEEELLSKGDHLVTLVIENKMKRES